MNYQNEPTSIQSEHDPGPQKHAGRRINPPTNRNTQNHPLIMRQGLTIHQKASSIAIADCAPFFLFLPIESTSSPERY